MLLEPLFLNRQYSHTIDGKQLGGEQACLNRTSDQLRVLTEKGNFKLRDWYCALPAILYTVLCTFKFFKSNQIMCAPN